MIEQQETYRLRGHHLFCLLGYRGMGYSEEYVENMTRVHQHLREQPEAWILIVHGPDDLCAKFPEQQVCHCEDPHIFERDADILLTVGLDVGQRIRWSEVEQRIRDRVVPEDIARVCSTCSWRGYGVCEEGVRRIHRGEGLYFVNALSR